jgi:hypothetical protein
MKNLDHISESSKTFFWVKILKFFDWDPGSGKEKIRIWDAKNLDPGSEIRDKHPDPQLWFLQLNNPYLCVSGLIILNNAASIVL